VRVDGSDRPQPALTGNMPRIRARDSQLVDGVRFFSPHLPEKGVQILCVSVAVTPEEASSLVETEGGDLQVKARLTKGPCGTIIMDNMNRFENLFSDHAAYTALIPWLLPKSRRFKPKPEEIAWAAPALHELIKERKPRCIVAFGKIAFDQLVGYKISADDARYGWFSYLDTDIPVYLCDPVTVLLTQPWSIDTLITDFREVDRMMLNRWGTPPEPRPRNYREIRTIDQLVELVTLWILGGYKLFSVDCEWAGNNYIDGHLRSIQFCWADGEVAYLNFFDETGDRHLGAAQNLGSIEAPVHPNQNVDPEDWYTDYQLVGRILGGWLNRDDVFYMGHHCSADSPWMEHWLGLDVLGKFSFDLEFAKQTCDEYAKLGLEVMALRYTQFGRYDMPLVMWKRENKMKSDDGYGKIPDSILIPYACIDVDVVWQCYKPVMQELEAQGLVDYFQGIVMPFVSDTFHTFVTNGLAVDPFLFDLTRKFFNWAYRALLEDFRNMMTEQADELVAAKAQMPLEAIKALATLRDLGQQTSAAYQLRLLSPCFPETLLEHWLNIRAFNIRSTKDMKRWLFDLMGMTPIKSTKNPNNGMPSMMWEKVMELPEKLRATLEPAVDKETIEILAESDESGALLRLLAVSNVGNQCKGFLKEGDRDEDGELVEENGLAKFICSDSRLHCNFSLTETGRPRSWKPNILNLSKYHNKGVMRGLARILENKDNNPRFVLPDEFDALFGTPEQREGRSAKDLIKTEMPSIRSTVKAPEGRCYVESDYRTAARMVCWARTSLLDIIQLPREKIPSATRRAAA
jgi:hypothetical protein